MQYPKPKLIALDLDETLLDSNSKLPPKNRAALLRAAAEGIHIVVASGRSYASLPQEMLELPGVQYAICSNGAAVCEAKTGKILYQRTLPKAAVHEILRRTKGEFLTYEAFLRGKPYAQQDYILEPQRYMADAQTVRYVKSTRQPVPNILDFILEHETELDCLDLVVGSMAVKEKMMEAMASIPDIYLTTSVPRLVELSHRDCGKHRGLQFLSERLGIAPSQVVAFGNADNDADMLRWAGWGIAVANGSPRCLEEADLITDHYLSEGVASALERWFGI
ncbi:MAG: HAD family hydrolase [Oscillospiraceae bacterium]|nr:HAD family hydrolase [Oscillospiraceae bacterium]